MSEIKNFRLKVPKTKRALVNEILKRWWYARDFKKQARRAFGFKQIKEFIVRKKRGDEEEKEDPLDKPLQLPHIGGFGLIYVGVRRFWIIGLICMIVYVIIDNYKFGNSVNRVWIY